MMRDLGRRRVVEFCEGRTLSELLDRGVEVR